MWPYILVAGVVIVTAVIAYVRLPNPNDAELKVLDRRLMPVPTRWALIAYLLAVATLSFYFLVVLWAVRFPDASFREAPSFSEEDRKRHANEGPVIRQTNPFSVVAGSTQPVLTVYGYNFAAGSKILFNTVPREAQFANPNTLYAPLNAADLAKPGPIAITVTVPEPAAPKPEPPKQAGAQPPAEPAPPAAVVRHSNLHILQVTPERERGTVSLFGRQTQVTEETRLILLVIWAGALGGMIHAIKSLVDYIGNRTVIASWTWFYITKPIVGSALAVIFYSVIRGGFLAGTPADAKAVNPFAVVALAGLVGMFADKASQKLGEIFDTLFKTDDKRKDTLNPPRITTDSLPKARTGVAYEHLIVCEGGEPPYTATATGLPAGLSLDKGTLKLSGTPAGPAGSSEVTITMQDKKGASVQKKLNLQVE